MDPAFAYRTILLGNTGLIILLLQLRPRRRGIVANKRNVALIAIALFIFWSIVDILAVHASVWSFPRDAYVHVGGLPLEEYIVFVVHTMLCATAVLIMEGKRRDRIPHSQ